MPPATAWLLVALLALDGCALRCLAQAAHAVLADASFRVAVSACVGRTDGTSGRTWDTIRHCVGRYTTFIAGEDPVGGNCVGGQFGPIWTWDTSRVTDMGYGARCNQSIILALESTDSM